MRKVLISLIVILLLFAACKQQPEEKPLELKSTPELDKAIEEQIEKSTPKIAYGIIREPVGDTDWIMLTHPNGDVTLVHKDEDIETSKERIREIQKTLSERIETGYEYGFGGTMPDLPSFDLAGGLLSELDLEPDWGDTDPGITFGKDVKLREYIEPAEIKTEEAMAKALGDLITGDKVLDPEKFHPDVIRSAKVYYSLKLDDTDEEAKDFEKLVKETEEKIDESTIFVYDKTYYAPHGGGLCTDSTCGAVVFRFETQDGDPVTASVKVEFNGVTLQKNPYQIGCRNDGQTMKVVELTLPENHELDGDLPKYAVQATCTSSENPGEAWIAKV